MQPTSQPTPQAQKSPQLIAVLHTLESAGISAVLTFLIGFFQAVSTHGLNWSTLGVTAGALFIGSMTQLYKALRGNGTFLIQVWTLLQQLYSSHVVLHNVVNDIKAQLAQQQPIVINNNHGTPAAQPAPVQQQASPVAATIPARPQFQVPPAITQFSVPMAAIGSQQQQQGQ